MPALHHNISNLSEFLLLEFTILPAAGIRLDQILPYHG
jgi:hypothetical protein